MMVKTNEWLWFLLTRLCRLIKIKCNGKPAESINETKVEPINDDLVELKRRTDHRLNGGLGGGSW